MPRQRRESVLASGPRERPRSPSGSDPLGNEPFGSGPEPGIRLIASILLLSPGEVPEGRARGIEDTATSIQSEGEG